VKAALEKGDLPEARRLVSWHLVSRDTSQLDASLVAAAAVESVAENITDGIVAPLLFFALAGLPGAWAYRFVNTCDSMLGYRDPVHEHLGKFAARLDDALNFFPARLAGLLLVVAAGLVGEDTTGAWQTMWHQHCRTASPNAGWTMSAMAGALGVTLEKVGHYQLEGGPTSPGVETIDRALRVTAVTVGLFVGLLGVVLAAAYIGTL
jgi:adenosylcobinamide-phosphate synthase